MPSVGLDYRVVLLMGSIITTVSLGVEHKGHCIDRCLANSMGILTEQLSRTFIFCVSVYLSFCVSTGHSFIVFKYRPQAILLASWASYEYHLQSNKWSLCRSFQRTYYSSLSCVVCAAVNKENSTLCCCRHKIVTVAISKSWQISIMHMSAVSPAQT